MATFSGPYTDKELIDMLARDNERLAEENRTLRQIVDGFCAFAQLMKAKDTSTATENPVPETTPA